MIEPINSKEVKMLNAERAAYAEKELQSHCQSELGLDKGAFSKVKALMTFEEKTRKTMVHTL
jgi:hypothetical protein